MAQRESPTNLEESASLKHSTSVLFWQKAVGPQRQVDPHWYNYMQVFLIYILLLNEKRI